MRHNLTYFLFFIVLPGPQKSCLSHKSVTVAAEKFRIDGPNEITPKEGVWWFWKFMAHIAGGFSLLLWAGSVMCGVVYGIDGSVENLTLCITLAVVVSATGTFSYYQELKSDNVLEQLLALAPSTCYVKRDNEWHQVNARELVKGDIIRRVGPKDVAEPTDVKFGIDTARDQKRKAVLILVNRRGSELFFALKLRKV
jgi:magnesium-transporting ATPase (P-type)